jgi:hypothetical protein
VIEKLHLLAGLQTEGGEPEGAEQEVDLPRPKRAPSRPKRWSDACERARDSLEELRDPQDEYRQWRETLPENFEGSALAEKLDLIDGIDIEGAIATLEEADAADLPLGFGRD